MHEENSIRGVYNGRDRLDWKLAQSDQPAVAGDPEIARPIQVAMAWKLKFKSTVT